MFRMLSVFIICLLQLQNCAFAQSGSMEPPDPIKDGIKNGWRPVGVAATTFNGLLYTTAWFLHPAAKRVGVCVEGGNLPNKLFRCDKIIVNDLDPEEYNVLGVAGAPNANGATTLWLMRGQFPRVRICNYFLGPGITGNLTCRADMEFLP